MKLQISHSDTEPSADKNSMCDREDNKDAEQEPEGIGDETVWRPLPKGFTTGDLTSAQPAFYVPTIRNSWGKCKAVRPGPPARSKMRLHKSSI